MDRKLRGLVTKAHTASSKCRWGHYPMAPSVGLSEKEIRLHDKALTANRAAEEALKAAGLTKEAEELSRAAENHSWVTSRRGSF